MIIEIGTKQNKCVNGTCTNKLLRDSGCFLCSNETGDEKCLTCIDDHLLFYGKCVECVSTELCPFNNTNATKCIKGDYSHCGFGGIGCKNHKCNMGGIGILIGCCVAVVVVALVVVVLYRRHKKKQASEGYSTITQEAL